MKTPQDHIFHLIHSMTPAEKRYFRRHFASDKAILSEVFDLINGQSAYDEAGIKANLGKDVAKQYKVLKVQLTDLLLKSLVSLGYKESVMGKIRQGLEEVDILLEKKMTDLASDRLAKVRKLSEKYEEFTYLIEVAFKELRIFFSRLDNSSTSGLTLVKTMRQGLHFLSVHAELAETVTRLQDMARYRLNKMTEEDLDYLRSLREKIERINPEPLSFRSRLTLAGIKSYVYSFLGEDELQLQNRMESVSMFRKNPWFQNTMPEVYMSALRNYGNYCFSKGYFEELEMIIREAGAVVEKNKAVFLQFTFFRFLELQIILRKNHFENLPPGYEKELVEHLKKYGQEKDRVAGLIYLELIIFHLANDKFSQAQLYLQRIKEVGDHLDPDYRSGALVLEMVNHLKTKDWEAMSKCLKIMARGPFSSPAFQAFMDLFQEILADPRQLPHAALALLRKLESAEDDDPFLHISNILYLRTWVQAKAKGRKFGSMIPRIEAKKSPTHLL